MSDQTGAYDLDFTGTVVPHFSDCFAQEGREAFMEECERSACPYDEGTDGRSGWLRGWDAAELNSSPGHRWSGWPGAYCLKCGAGHALETAIADGWFDPIDGKFDTEEHQNMVNQADGTCHADVLKE